MNRFVATSATAFPDPAAHSSARELWPPATPVPGVARVLFVHVAELGFGTTARNLIAAAAADERFDAVHLWAPTPLWARVMGKQLSRALLGLDLHNTRLTWALSRAAGAVLKAHVPLGHFDVVHIMTRERAGFILSPWFAGLASRPKTIVNVDATLPAWDRAFEIRRLTHLDYATDRRILQAADAVAFASDWARDSGLADHQLDAARCFLHRPCVPLPKGGSPVSSAQPLRPPEADLKDPAAYQARLKRVIFVGNDFARKGGARLLDWHKARWMDKMELHICSAHAPKVLPPGHRNLILHGRTDHAVLVGELLPRMDFMVIPTFEDTFLIAAQEAQLMGLPVVTTRIAGVGEVVLHEQSGLLASRHDDSGYIAAIERLLEDPALLRRLSVGALQHAQRDLNAEKWHGALLDRIVQMVQVH